MTVSCDFGLHLVGRIEKHNVCGMRRQCPQHRSRHHARAIFDSQRVQVLPDRIHSVAGALQKNAAGGATAERFNPHGACARVRIQENRAGDAGRQHIEKRFAQPVGSGPRVQTWKGLQPARPELSTNHTHQPTVTRPYCRCQWSRM